MRGRGRQTTLLIAVGAIIFACLLFYRFLGGDPSSQASVPSPQPNAVGALGRIEPESEIINVSSGLADRLESLLVRRGDRVKKDQILGRLQGYAEQVAQREQIAALLAEAKVKMAAEVEVDLVRIENAEIKLRQVNEVSPSRIAAQEATVASIESGLANNRSILAAQTQLLNARTTSQRTFDDQKTLVLQGEANLAASQARVLELKRQFVLDQLDARSQIRLAKASLERAKVDFGIDSLSKQLALAEARVQRMTITSPIDGRVLNVLARPGEQVGTAPMLTIGDTDRMRAVAEVYETDINRVQLGQRAVISGRALAEPLGGRVVEIGSMIFKNDVLNVDPAAKTDARVVEVRKSKSTSPSASPG